MTPVLYVSDVQFADFDPADLFDLAFLLRAPGYELVGVCLRDDSENGERIIDALSLAASKPCPTVLHGADGFANALRDAPEPVNVVVVGGYKCVAGVLQAEPALIRQKVARLFLVGGHVNDYTGADNEKINVPVDPRLRDRFPERFAPEGDARIVKTASVASWGALLTSGEGVIWLPRDVCLFRYGAPGVLRGGGPLCDFLLRELFWANLQTNPDRYQAADAPVLLSALPALLLAQQPDPFGWMRLFRAALARVEVGEPEHAPSFSTTSDKPNLYAITAIDGQALGKRLTHVLRDAPLSTA